jgi:sporulation protein YlmC with PRC-barrel domain
MKKAEKADKHRLSKLIGKNVETSAGDTIGEVKDVVIDEQGKATHVIVSHGRLGSTKLTAVPFDTVKQMMRADKLVMDKTRLENAPSFDESSFPNVTSTTWSSSYDRYWERSRSASAAGATDTGSAGSASSSDTSTSSDTSSSSSSSSSSMPSTTDPSTSDPASSTPGSPDSSIPPSSPSSPDSTSPSSDPTDPTATEPSSTETPPPG